MIKCVSLTYSARQSARLKRRWPLRKALIAAPKEVQVAIKNLRDVFLELANVTEVEFSEKLPEYNAERWALASEGDVHVLLDVYRDEVLQGRGLMRDLARRVQSLRKELGFVPTDVLEAVHIAGLDEESVRLIEPLTSEMAELVRAKKVNLHKQRSSVEGVEWHEYPLDKTKVLIAISQTPKESS